MPEERLQKIISRYGVASRRQAEAMIEAGRVRVNGNTAHLGDTAIDGEDQIQVDGVFLRKEPASSPPCSMSRVAEPFGNWWQTAASVSTPWAGWT